MKPRLLDLFCCGGGAAMGYHLAGFEVIGVDIEPQPRYPFAFVQADALTYPLEGFDAIHASPPCQAYSIAARQRREAGHQYPDLLEPIRQRLLVSDVPWVIENVPGAPMRADYILCGSMFNLKIVRHRWFEVSWGPLLELVSPCSHAYDAIPVVGHGTPSWEREKRRKRGLKADVLIADRRAAMEMPWANRYETSQAIPPAYTRFLGERLLIQCKK